MPPIVKQVSSRSHIITSANDGMILTIGPAATTTSIGTMVIQFNPDVASNFSVVVMGRCWGQAAKDQDVPFVPISYRVASLNNVAQLYELAIAAISQSALIQIPGNWEIGLLVSCSAGECSMTSWPLLGNSAP